MYTDKEEEKLSFIIPVFNLYKNEETLNRSIRGLDSYHLLEDCEVIVSDYGSEDETKELIEQYDFTYLRTEPNEGEEFNYCKCGNNGIAEAKTKYIIVLGVDWIIDPQVPQMILDKFNGNYTHVFQIKSNELKREDRRIIFNQVFYRRLHLLLSGGYDERFNKWGNEDNDLLKRVLKTNQLHKRLISEKILAQHITHPYVWRKQKNEPSNIAILKDNDINGNKNIINSYWSLDDKYILGLAYLYDHKNPIRYLFENILGLLGRFRVWRNFLRWVYFHIPDDYCQGLFEKYKPDLVFAPNISFPVYIYI